MSIRPFTIGIAALLLGLSSTGCSKSQPPKATSSRSAEATSPQTQPQEPPPSVGGAGPGEHAGAAHPDTETEPVATGGSAAELWGQIATQQTKLEDVMRTGRLADVHHIAYAIRDLSVAAAGKVSGPSAANAAKIDATLEQIKKSASTLDEYGDAGNLGGVKQEYARLQQQLTTLRSLVGGL